ncbi:MAG TPA: transglutaminaseTgpA domain-containing protein, partial [Ilumatobacteraceae bacterium]
MELNDAPPLTNGRRVARAFAVLVFASGLALSGARVVGTRLEPVLFIPAAIAVLVGWLLSRIHVVPRIVGFLVAFVGSSLAVAFASDGTASSFGRGLLDGPRQVVTTAWPSPRFATIFVALAALIFVVSAIATDLAMRIRWRSFPVVPLIIGMVALIAVGAPDGPQWQAIACAAVAGFLLLWIGLDDRVASIRAGSVVAVSIGLAAFVTTVGVSVATADRANPRTGEPADRQLSLLDPLAEISAQSRTKPAVVLYTLDSPQLDVLHRWRTAALDVYNGESWSTSGKLTPIGNRVDAPTGATRITVKVTANRDDTVLWVSPGRLIRSTSPVESDPQRRVVRIIGAQRPASTVFTVEPLADFDPATTAQVARVQATDIESSYKPLATRMAGTGTVAAQVAHLATALKTTYKLNPDTPGGVQQNLVDRFLGTTKLGNAEQFVTSFVLLARSLGVDSRVATGYELDTPLDQTTITTDDAIAWAEVRVGADWFAVDVLPPDSVSGTPKNTPVGRPETPPALQPQRPAQVDTADPNDPVDAPLTPASVGRWTTVEVWAVRSGVFAGLMLWPIVVFALIVTWKKLRRRRGLKADDPARRV